MTSSTGDDALIAQGTSRSLQLLQRNLTPQGILAATRSPASEARSYTRIFGRDAAICALAMAGSGDAALERGAIASLDALAQAQAPNGQIPKYVDPTGEDVDFWYLGCIDATLWWLIAVEHVCRVGAEPGLADRWSTQVRLALQWLLAQEHQRFFLLQQNEASDWADIMPRSGFVLYTNALWFRVKRLYGLARPEATFTQFNEVFDPFRREMPEYRRSRLMRHFARRGRRGSGLYISFVNFSFVGHEGDVFGNLLAILFGLAGDAMAHQIVRAMLAARVAEPYPVRVVTHPMGVDDPFWRMYMNRHKQNHPYQYHNGGIWPFVGGYWVMALAQMGMHDLAAAELAKLAQVNRLDNWRFTEWFHGRTLKPAGMGGQSWNAATFLIASKALEQNVAAVRRSSA